MRFSSGLPLLAARAGSARRAQVQEAMEGMELAEPQTQWPAHVKVDPACMSRLQPESGADEKILWLCASLCKTRRLEDALALIEDACVLRPLQAEYHHRRGQVLCECERYFEALEAFDRALMLKPACAPMQSSRRRLILRMAVLRA